MISSITTVPSTPGEIAVIGSGIAVSAARVRLAGARRRGADDRAGVERVAGLRVALRFAVPAARRVRVADRLAVVVARRRVDAARAPAPLAI